MVGPAAPNYRNGRYSKYLPARMAAKYREAEKDPDLLSLREDVKALDARISDVLTRVDTGESGALWSRLQDAYEDFREARAAGNTPATVARMQTALGRMEVAITAGAQDWAAWEQVVKLWEQRRKLVETEHKRLLSLEQFLSHEKVMLMMGALMDIITRHVPDKQALSAIVVELQQLAQREQAQMPVYGVDEA